MNKRQQTLEKRRLAYVRTFYGDSEQLLSDPQTVLADLRRFCGINKGGMVVSPKSGMVDSHATMYRAGQRDVYLRIVAFLNLDESQEISTEEEQGDVAET
jgi:hypothetical protein